MLLSAADTTYEVVLSACEMGYQNGTAKTSGLPPDGEVKQTNNTNQFRLLVTPNPSNGYIVVHTETDDSRLMAIQKNFTIQDLAGKVVMQGKMNNDAGTLIAFGNLANGAYFIHVNSQYETLGTEKIILSR